MDVFYGQQQQIRTAAQQGIEQDAPLRRKEGERQTAEQRPGDFGALVDQSVE